MQWVIILTWLFKNRGIFLNITFGNTINMTKVIKIKIIKIMISTAECLFRSVEFGPQGTKTSPVISSQTRTFRAPVSDEVRITKCWRSSLNVTTVQGQHSLFQYHHHHQHHWKKHFFSNIAKAKKTQTQGEFLVERKTEHYFDHFCPELQLFNFLW